MLRSMRVRRRTADFLLSKRGGGARSRRAVLGRGSGSGSG